MLTNFVISFATLAALICGDKAIDRYQAGLTSAGHLWTIAAAFDLFILLSTLYSLHKERRRS